MRAPVDSSTPLLMGVSEGHQTKTGKCDGGLGGKVAGLVWIEEDMRGQICVLVIMLLL